MAGSARFRIIGSAVYPDAGKKNDSKRYGDKLEDCQLVGSDTVEKTLR
jgi:hypothetical protein